jgi:hypothetical protein
VVIDAEDKAIKATLIFENTEVIEDLSVNRESGLFRCENSRTGLTVSTGKNGYFNVNIDRSGTYYIQVLAERYKPLQMQLEVTYSKEDVLIKLK